MGEGNASVHGAEPTRYGPDWGGLGGAPARAFHHVRLPGGARRGLRGDDGARAWSPVRGTRGITRDALTWNTAAPSDLAISPVDGTVTLDGRVLACEPTATVPMSRRYLLA